METVMMMAIIDIYQASCHTHMKTAYNYDVHTCLASTLSDRTCVYENCEVNDDDYHRCLPSSLFMLACLLDRHQQPAGRVGHGRGRVQRDDGGHV